MPVLCFEHLAHPLEDGCPESLTNYFLTTRHSLTRIKDLVG